MPETNEKSSGSEIRTGPGAAILVADEFRRLYLVVLGFLILLGLFLCSAGIYVIWYWIFRNKYLFVEERVSLTSGVLYLAGGILVIIIAFVLRNLRRYFRHVRETAAARIESAELSKLKEDDFEKVDEILEIRDAKARVDFERNLQDAFLVSSLALNNVKFFSNCSWQFRPGVNVLLGRNGYGKSLALRVLGAMLQEDKKASQDLLTDESSDDQISDISRNCFIELIVERNGVQEVVRRERRRFKKTVGKIPILAIPDSRFVNRNNLEIQSLVEGAPDLSRDGARHFLENLSYGEMMDMLFSELCLDYLERGSFERPGFTLLEKAIGTLTNDRFRFHSVERVGRTSFHLFVLSEGNSEPLPIQLASQGTLSVLGVLGIIRSYLIDLFPDSRDGEDLLKKPAIVLIDELDAHLHPLWQQKLAGILRDNFPNIQFVLTAHSPLVVSGCWSGEVTVLRPSATGFELRQVEEDFIGTPLADIYKKIFEVEEFDQKYREAAGKAIGRFTHQERIAELEKKDEPTELERRELARLVREEGIIRRAGEVEDQRARQQEHVFDLEAQVEALTDTLKTYQPNNH